MTPALATSLSIPAGNAPVQIWFTRSGNGTSRIVRVTLTASGGITLGTAQVTFTPSDTTPTLQTFTVPITAATLPAGATISLQVTNNTTGSGSRDVLVYPANSAAQRSNVSFNSNTVISVSSVLSYNAAYAGGVATASFVPGNTVFMRAVVSDPFGSFDIAGASVTLLNPSGTAVLTNSAMTQVNDSGAATKTYELSLRLARRSACRLLDHESHGCRRNRRHGDRPRYRHV